MEMVYDSPDHKGSFIKAKDKLIDFFDVNWSSSFKLLFPEEEEDWGTDENWSAGFKLLFPEEEEDWGADLRRLFAIPKPFYRLDLEAIRKGPPLFVSIADCAYSDDELEGEPGFAAYNVPVTRAGKKPSLFKSCASQKYTRRSGRVFPQRRALKILSKTLRGGIYENQNIEYGSYGPCGHEL